MLDSPSDAGRTAFSALTFAASTLPSLTTASASLSATVEPVTETSVPPPVVAVSDAAPTRVPSLSTSLTYASTWLAM